MGASNMTFRSMCTRCKRTKAAFEFERDLSWDEILHLQLTKQIPESTRSETSHHGQLGRWVVPNIGRQLILECCIHGVAE
jgi:hypothetical protein